MRGYAGITGFCLFVCFLKPGSITQTAFSFCYCQMCREPKAPAVGGGGLEGIMWLMVPTYRPENIWMQKMVSNLLSKRCLLTL